MPRVNDRRNIRHQGFIWIFRDVEEYGKQENRADDIGQCRMIKEPFGGWDELGKQMPRHRNQQNQESCDGDENQYERAAAAKTRVQSIACRPDQRLNDRAFKGVRAAHQKFQAGIVGEVADVERNDSVIEGVERTVPEVGETIGQHLSCRKRFLNF